MLSMLLLPMVQLNAQSFCDSLTEKCNYVKELYARGVDVTNFANKVLETSQLKNVEESCASKNYLMLFNTMINNYQQHNQPQMSLQVITRLDSLNSKGLLYDYNNPDFIEIKKHKAEIYSILNKNEKSISLLKGLWAKRNVNNSKYINAFVLSDIGNYYVKLYELQGNESLIDSANLYFKKFLSYAQKDIILNRSEVVFQFNLNKLAILNAKKAYPEVIKRVYDLYFMDDELQNSETNKTKFELYLAQAFFTMGQLDSALVHNRNVAKNLNILKPENKIEHYNLFNKIYAAKHNKDSVNKYAQLIISEFKDYDTFKENSVQNLHNSDMKQVLSANTKLEVQRRQNSIRFAILIGVLLLSSIFIFYELNRQKTKAAKAYQQRFEEYSNIYEMKKQPQPNNSNGVGLSKEKINEIEKKLKKMESNGDFLNKNFTLNTLAKKLNSNTSYLSFYFNHVKMQSFPNYLNHLRINYILEQLQDNPKLLNYSIEGLAHECGYNDASVFSKIFKNIVEVPPSYYIQQIQKQKNLKT